MTKKINLGFIYFILPLLFFAYIKFNDSQDMWFLFSHGRYVFNHGFPHMEFLTIHEGFHFVMQQWGFSFLVYLLYHYMESIGIVCFVGLLNIFILFFIYKLCFRISNNSYFSCLLAAFIDWILELSFITVRPQVFSLLIFLLEVYTLEKKDKSLYLLPVFSILLVNFHASMWLMFFVICMPFVVECFIKKDKYFFKLLVVMLLSFFVGFINPYGIEAMTYSLFSYGISSINEMVGEMQSFSFIGADFVVYNSVLFFILFLLSIVTILFRIKKVSWHAIFLILGLSLMSFLNLRNIALFLVCAMPYTILLFSKDIDYRISRKYCMILGLLILLFFSIRTSTGVYKLEDVRIKEVVEFLDKSYDRKEMILYNDFDDGPYLEYRGYKTYIDTRAEVFIQKVNHKEDILDEYYKVIHGSICYSCFFEKYSFTHFIVWKNTPIYEFITSNENYREVYNKNEEVYVFLKELK